MAATIGDDDLDRLRTTLAAVGYTHDGVADLLGRDAHAALGRNETTPGLRATSGGGALETLTRLWLLQSPVEAAAVERALPGLVEVLCGAGILVRAGGEVVAAMDLRPYAADDLDLWIAGDLTPGLDGGESRVGPDHVLGLSPAATSLAQLTIRDPVGTALDLGTGCGVQALHLSTHVDRIVATDINPRALWTADLNARLNGCAGIELREGSLFTPVAGERFDLVTTNPPFVISPGTGERLVYRDSGLPGDQVVEEVVRGLPAHLTRGGTGQVLANWLIRRDLPWQERLGAWFGESVDAWVVQREMLDPAAYVELWLKDAGLHGAPDYRQRYDGWLTWFDSVGAEAVGFGWIHVRNGGSGRHRLEEWPWEVAQPLGEEVAAHFDRVRRLAALDDAALLATRPVLRADVVQEARGPAGAADPETIVLRRQTGMRRAHQVDTVVAGFCGAADGELTTGQLLAALSDLLDRPTSGRLGEVRELVTEGFLDL